jgi:hypothetical protein
MAKVRDGFILSGFFLCHGFKDLVHTSVIGQESLLWEYGS